MGGLISNHLPFTPAKNPPLVSASFDWLEDVLSQGQGMKRGGSGVPCALWMSTVTILKTGQTSSLSLPLEIILMVSLLMLKCLFSLSEVLYLVCCDLRCYFDQAILTFYLFCFLPGPRQSSLHISRASLLSSREGCHLPLHSELRSPGACPGSPRKRAAGRS